MAARNVCVTCGKTENLFLCSKCNSVSYCGREHQKQDWNNHKKTCKKLRETEKTKESKGSTPPANGKTKNIVPNGESPQNPSDNMNDVLEDIGALSIRAENPQFMPQWVSQNSLALNVSERFSQREEGMVKLIIKNMLTYGICVIDKFLEDSDADACLADVRTLYRDASSFKAGQIIQPGSNVQKIRGDKVRWLDGTEEMAKNLSFLCGKMDTIISNCNSKLNYKIAQRTKVRKCGM